MYFFHSIVAVQRQQMIFMKYFLPRQSSKLTPNGHLFFTTKSISKHYNFSDPASSQMVYFYDNKEERNEFY